MDTMTTFTLTVTVTCSDPVTPEMLARIKTKTMNSVFNTCDRTCSGLLTVSVGVEKVAETVS